MAQLGLVEPELLYVWKGVFSPLVLVLPSLLGQP